jgi:UDP-N-acetyl-D-glucosamine dehydrogenase
MRIAIIGLGYVGLPLALRFVESGVSILGLDVDPEKVEQLNAGRSRVAAGDLFKGIADA